MAEVDFPAFHASPRISVAIESRVHSPPLSPRESLPSVATVA